MPISSGVTMVNRGPASLLRSILLLFMCYGPIADGRKYVGLLMRAIVYEGSWGSGYGGDDKAAPLPRRESDLHIQNRPKS